MCVINFSNNEKDIASINISLTSEPPYLNHIVGLCISLTGYPFYLTDIFNLLISLEFEPPYVIGSTHINIPPNVKTRPLGV